MPRLDIIQLKPYTKYKVKNKFIDLLKNFLERKPNHMLEYVEDKPTVFSVSQMAKLFNISSQAVRYYHKEGILVPATANTGITKFIP